MLWHPWKVALAGIVAWLVIRLISPVEVVYPLYGIAVAYVLVNYAGFFIGCFLAEATSRVRDDFFVHYEGQMNSAMFWGSMIAGVIGFVTKVVDRIYFRGVDYFAGSTAIRETLQNTAATPVGAIGVFLMPLCYLPMFMLVSSKPGPHYARLIALAAVSFSLPILEGLGQLSRIFFLSSTFMLFAAVALMRFRGRVLIPQLILPGALLVIGLGTLSTVMLTARLDTRANYSLTDSIYESAYAQSISASTDAKEKIVAGNAVEQQVYSTAVPTVLYYLSGAYELSRLMTRPDDQVHSYGLLLAQPYAKLISALFSIEQLRGTDDDQLYLRVGVYTSFFGPWWIDFAWFGVLLITLVGFACTRLAQRTRIGYVNTLPLYVLTLTMIFYSPVISLINSGDGFFALQAFVGFALFTSFQRSGGRAEGSEVAARGQMAGASR